MPSVEALAPLARTLRSLDPGAAPQAAAVCGSGLAAARRLVAVPGSFNPPHAAHLALMEAGLAAANAGAGAFVLSVRTVDKERVSGMLLEDRLWLLCRLAEEVAAATGGVVGAVATNRGLYVDQAAAIRRLCSNLVDLAFVVGYDKLVQILDARYYDDRDAALEALFARARFLVAPRDGNAVEAIAALLARPENARFAGRVRALPVSPALARVSSTAARAAAAGGQPVAGVPPLVAAFVAATGCYREPDGKGAYGRRAAELEALLARPATTGN